MAILASFRDTIKDATYNGDMVGCVVVDTNGYFHILKKDAWCEPPTVLTVIKTTVITPDMSQVERSGVLWLWDNVKGHKINC